MYNQSINLLLMNGIMSFYKFHGFIFAIVRCFGQRTTRRLYETTNSLPHSCLHYKDIF